MRGEEGVQVDSHLPHQLLGDAEIGVGQDSED
jgi:hypothetical protein